MIRFVLLVVILLPPAAAQPVPPEDRPPARLQGGRWVAPALPPTVFLPPLDGQLGEATVWAPPGEVRASLLEVGIGTGFSFAATIRRAGGAGLRLAFGADPWRTRGWELDCGGPGRDAALYRLSVEGPERVSSVAWPKAAKPGGAHRIEVGLTGTSLTLSIDGKKRSPRGGWRLGSVVSGRFHLGAADGAVRMEDMSLSFSLASQSRRRLAVTEARGALSPLPSPRVVPLQGPLDSIDAGLLGEGLEPDAAARLLEIRAQAVNGKVREALAALKTFRKKHPAAVGPAFVAGATRMLELADAPGALADLRRARSFPRAEALLGDAAWMIGDLQTAHAAYRRSGDVGGRALVHWARGRRERAIELAKAGRSRGCRRAGQRLRLVDDLAMLESWPEFFRADHERVHVISDLSKARAQRALRMTLPFVQAIDGWMPGESAPAPLTVFVCGARDVFAQWNDRLGGARFEEADGIYRPGTGLLVVLDDDDGEVLRRRLQHECVHHVIWERGWAIPRPFEEGLCELLAHGRAAGRTIGRLDSVAPSRILLARQLARDGQLEDPSDVLMRLEMRDGDRGREDYAQAWAAWWTLAGRRGGEKVIEDLILMAGNPDRRDDLRRAVRSALPKASVVSRLTRD